MEIGNHMHSDSREDISHSTAFRLVSAIILLAAILRLWGIWHGYPFSYYPDEEHFVKRALAFGSGDLNPHWFHKPAFYMYLLFVEYGLFYILGKIVGFWNSINDFGLFYVQNPGPFYLIGRITTALFSVGSIFVTYLTGKSMFNRRVGVIACLILTLSLGHVMVAKDVKADTPCMFFTICSAYFVVRYLGEKKVKHIILSSIFAGIGMSTKSYSIVMLGAIFVALGFSPGLRNVKRLLSGMGIFIICVFTFYSTHFVFSPYNFLDPLGRDATFGPVQRVINKATKFILDDNNRGSESESVKKDAAKRPWGRDGYIRGTQEYAMVIYQGLGAAISVTLIAALIFLLFNPSKTQVAFFAAPVFFAAISIFASPGYAEIRHQVVLYPFLAVCCAIFLVAVLDRITAINKLGYGALIILFLPMYHVIAYDIHISKADTRALAKRWIEENIESGTKIVMEEDAVKISPNREYYETLLRRTVEFGESQFTGKNDIYYGLKLKGLPEITYDIFYIRHAWWQVEERSSGVYFATSEYDIDMGNPAKPVGVMPYEFYKANDYKIVITTSEDYLDYQEGTERGDRFPSFRRFYETLFKEGKLLKEFDPQSGNRPGPIVKIFEIE